MADSEDVAEARRRVEQARTKMWATFDELVDYGQALQRKLEPSHLARDAWDAAKNKSVDLAEDAVDAVRKRPVAATGAVAPGTIVSVPSGRSLSCCAIVSPPFGLQPCSRAAVPLYGHECCAVDAVFY
jgi:hypothetical protein